MEVFYRTHKYLIEHLNGVAPRVLMDQINRNQRLIAIKGTRGVGKTTFLLQYAKENFAQDSRECLYINLNHFYFTDHTIIDFTKAFQQNGGRTLLLDQVFKYPNWEEELKICYHQFPDIQIIFTVSTVSRSCNDDSSLKEIVDTYNLRGFSFREFLNITQNKSFRYYSLAEIIENHKEIAVSINKEINAKDFLWDYMHHGYYPFFLEKKNFSENLLKNINMMLEIDVLSIRKIEHSYLPKIRKLLYLLAQTAPSKPNISQLSAACEISRATVSNYFECLKSARLINMLYNEGETFPKKTEMIYLHNTNLIFPMQMTSNVDEKTLRETFFYNQIHHSDAIINKGKKKATFIVGDSKNSTKSIFRIEGCKQNLSKKNGYIQVIDGLDEGSNGIIPLWLFGFLY